MEANIAFWLASLVYDDKFYSIAQLEEGFDY